jgi:hypothetical protein
MITIGKNAIVSTLSRKGNGYNVRVKNGICYVDKATFDRLMASDTLTGLIIDDENPNTLTGENGDTVTFPLAGLKEDVQLVNLNRANALIAVAEGVDKTKLQNAIKMAKDIESVLA